MSTGRTSQTEIHLQTGAVDDLEVDNELTATVVDDEGTDGATAIGKGITDALEQTTLADDGETLLDIASLSHGDQAAVVTEVQDAVGLVDRAEHGLDHNGGRGVGDEAGLLLQLAGEEVDTQVAVLAGLGGDRDADDLAGAALQDEDVANADEVAGDGDGLADGAAVAGLHDADLLADAVAVAGRTALVAHDDILTVMVVEGVEDAVSSTLDAAAERVVVTLVVVVTHLAGGGDGFTDSVLDLGGGRVVARSRSLGDFDLATGVAVALVVGGGLGLVGSTVVRDVDFVGGRGPATVLSLSDVELVLDGLVVDLRTFLEAVVGVAKELESVRGRGVVGGYKQKQHGCVTAHWRRWSPMG